MAKMKTYSSNAKIKARQVTAKDGETVVTSAGPAHAAKGQYVTEDPVTGEVRIQDADVFESAWKTPTKARKSTPKPSRKPEDNATPEGTDVTPVAQTENVTADKRVKVAQRLGE